jgi:HAD superfamily hydrolase (TIGR01450 family)
VSPSDPRVRTEPTAPTVQAQVGSSDHDFSAIDTVFLDLDGCVWFGDELADGALELVTALRASGRRVVFLTNTSNSRAADVAAKLRRLGVQATADDVVLPVDVLGDHPALQDDPRIWYVGPSAVRDAVAEVAQLAERPEDADVLLLGRDTSLTYDDLADALDVLMRGGRLLAFNVDPRIPVGGGRVLPGTGAIAAALTYASGVRADVVGKPAATFFQAAMRRFGATADRSVMIGDTLDSDIAGGHSVGMRTVLVGDGALSALEPPPSPDHRVPDLRATWALFAAPGAFATEEA